jgi:hypothetical protein
MFKPSVFDDARCILGRNLNQRVGGGHPAYDEKGLVLQLGDGRERQFHQARPIFRDSAGSELELLGAAQHLRHTNRAT